LVSSGRGGKELREKGGGAKKKGRLQRATYYEDDFGVAKQRLRFGREGHLSLSSETVGSRGGGEKEGRDLPLGKSKGGAVGGVAGKSKEKVRNCGNRGKMLEGYKRSEKGEKSAWRDGENTAVGDHSGGSEAGQAKKKLWKGFFKFRRTGKDMIAAL